MEEDRKIFVRRATDTAALETLLRSIAAKDRRPQVIVDKQATATEDPQFTVIFTQHKSETEPPR